MFGLRMLLTFVVAVIVGGVAWLMWGSYSWAPALLGLGIGIIYAAVTADMWVDP